MHPNSDALTAWAVAVSVAGALIGDKAAVIVGTYGLIFLGWFCGLMYGLWARPVESRMPVWAYAVFTLGVTMFGAVAAAELIAKWSPWDTKWTSLLFPIAVAVPALPHKWGDAGEWILKKFQSATGVRQ